MWECTQCRRCCRIDAAIDGEDIRVIENLGYAGFTQKKNGDTNRFRYLVLYS